ncbi:MAG: hypothetical protein QOI31_2109, partial [Solirubrobacterales bacterium]|nr:hypothetical protein [Solirubrobacterales bacterium]
MGDDPVAPSAAEKIPRLTPRELDVLQEVGRHWRSVLRDRLGRLAELPVDPTLRFHHHRPGRGRFVEMSLFRPEGPDELEATEEAVKPVSRAGRLVDAVQRIVMGPPLRSSAVAHERMRKLVALPVLSSDLLSSVAYGPEAMLSVLVLAGAVGLRLALPLAAVVVVLMIAVGASYRQTIAAYPSGAGSYIVAGDNLGELAGLAAAVGLLADYVLTVAVSVAAGIAAITSALPSLERWTVPLGLAAITLLLAGNL